jgi:hypothetical protein
MDMNRQIEHLIRKYGDLRIESAAEAFAVCTCTIRPEQTTTEKAFCIQVRIAVRPQFFMDSVHTAGCMPPLPLPLPPPPPPPLLLLQENAVHFGVESSEILVFG